MRVNLDELSPRADVSRVFMNMKRMEVRLGRKVFREAEITITDEGTAIIDLVGKKAKSK